MQRLLGAVTFLVYLITSDRCLSVRYRTCISVGVYTPTFNFSLDIYQFFLYFSKIFSI
nr:hypothetical protein HWPLAUVJ_HWPLAUVJ_CDS_0004 [Microvirus sp.]